MLLLLLHNKFVHKYFPQVAAPKVVFELSCDGMEKIIKVISKSALNFP